MFTVSFPPHSAQVGPCFVNEGSKAEREPSVQSDGAGGGSTDTPLLLPTDHTASPSSRKRGN